MRTTSATAGKGAEPPRGPLDDLALLWSIAAMLFDYLWVGRRVRREFFARQRAGDKYYVDEA